MSKIGRSLENTVGGFTVDEIKEQLWGTGSPDRSVWIDEVKSANPDYEAQKASAVEKIDRLLRWLDVIPSGDGHWTDKLLEASSSNDLERQQALERSDILKAARPCSPGEVVHELAYDALEMEDEEDGESVAELVFNLGVLTRLSIVATGNFWTEDTYVDADGNEIDMSTSTSHLHIDEADDEKTVWEREADGEISLKDSAVNWEIKFEAQEPF